MEVRLLGPLEVVLHGRPVRLTGRLRTLLLMLSMSAGKTVSVFQLAGALWGSACPPTPAPACRPISRGCATPWAPRSTRCEGLECYEHSLALYHRLGDRFGTADTLVRIGEAHRRAGDTGPAVRAWRRALEILEELGHAGAVKVSGMLAAVSTRA